MRTPSEAADYVRRIRSPGKKAYAIAYLNYRASDFPGPARPDSSQFNVSVMGAQAVRMRLDSIFRESFGGTFAVADGCSCDD